MSRPAISCEGVRRRFGPVLALDGIALEAGRGEVLAVIGPSGCGKTTLLRVLAGFERPDAGLVAVGGRTVADGRVFVPPETRRVGFVFQDYALFPHLTVAGNVGFGAAQAGDVRDALALVGLLGTEDRFTHELSGGQQQRVALARALAARPEVLLLDEPFSNLDADLRVRVRGEVGEILRRSGTTVIIVTHDQQEAFDLADRIAVMSHGRIEQIGDAEELYHAPRSRFVADFVGEAAFLPVSVSPAAMSSEIGPLPAPTDRVEPGPAELMLRPEDVTLTAADPADGVVVRRRFRGPGVLTTVRLRSGAIVTAAHDVRNSYPTGTGVRVGVAAGHLVVFRGERLLAHIASPAAAGRSVIAQRAGPPG